MVGEAGRGERISSRKHLGSRENERERERWSVRDQPVRQPPVRQT